ncbi:hypothetical protein HK096_001611 [Nowakowskiella sp. JEL0078]|nr:hypothetical protein HK096_001611 [Nowakowskiella sp. JEL0078]
MFAIDDENSEEQVGNSSNDITIDTVDVKEKLLTEHLPGQKKYTFPPHSLSQISQYNSPTKETLPYKVAYIPPGAENPYLADYDYTASPNHKINIHSTPLSSSFTYRTAELPLKTENIKRVVALKPEPSILEAFCDALLELIPGKLLEKNIPTHDFRELPVSQFGKANQDANREILKATVEKNYTNRFPEIASSSNSVTENQSSRSAHPYSIPSSEC